MKFTSTKRIIWNGEDDVEVAGELQEFKPGIGLFHRGKKWWLAHDDDIIHNTGPFKSKKAAIAFYNNSGR